MKVSLLLLALFLLGILIFYWMLPGQPVTKSAKQWQQEKWMQIDKSLPTESSRPLLAMTDLPLLQPTPEPSDFLSAKSKSTEAGCNAAVISISWSALEAAPDQYTFDELKGSVMLQQGRYLFFGIQVVNTTVKDLPADLQDRAFDDPEVLTRFCKLLDALAPLLKNRIRYLSIGNETDVYLNANPEQRDSYRLFLNGAYKHAKSISPSLTVGTTLTDAGVLEEPFRELVQDMDAHFLTYYHGQHGLEGTFKDPTKTKSELMKLVQSLDARPIVFQEIGYPAHPDLGSPKGQAEFVAGVFDAWEELDDRIAFVNYFMLYDFPKHFVQQQLAYYGVAEDSKPLTNFIGSLGLHDARGNPRPGWQIFQERGSQIQKNP